MRRSKKDKIEVNMGLMSQWLSDFFNNPENIDSKTARKNFYEAGLIGKNTWLLRYNIISKDLGMEIGMTVQFKAKKLYEETPAQ